MPKLIHSQYDCYDTIANQNIECPVDIEYSLPDYCPDIQKILKCIAYPNLSSYSVTQEKIMCEGKLILLVQYLDEKSETVRECEVQKEFSHVGSVPVNDGKVLSKIDIDTGHMICRAISARKLDIHIPVLLGLTLQKHTENKINCDAESLEKKTEKVKVSHAVNAVNYMFSIEQELELSQSLAPIESVLRRDIKINNLSCTAMKDKVQIDAIADIFLVYRGFSENSVIEKMQYSIPFSQTVDINDVDSDCKIICDIIVNEFSMQPKEDENDEYTLCDMCAKISAYITTYMDKEIDIIVDAYSTESICKMKYEDINLCYLSEKYIDKITLNKSVFLAEDEIERMIDYWCEGVNLTPYCEKNKISYRGKFDVCMIYKGKSGQIFSLTKNFDFTTTREFSESIQRKCESNLSINIKDFRIIDGNNLEFNCEAILHSNDFECSTKKMLKDVEEVIGENQIDKNSIKVYYSQSGESLWDIGKRYFVSVDEIIANNKLTDEEFATKTALLIY